MSNYRYKGIPCPALASPRVKTVRLREAAEEVHEAVERAREFERRRIHEHQRRIGDYDRFLEKEGLPANVVPIDASRGEPTQGRG